MLAVANHNQFVSNLADCRNESVFATVAISPHLDFGSVIAMLIAPTF